MKTRPPVRHDINTLRGVAILGIVLYHLFLVQGNTGLLAGGFIGVEVFFAISGFLITKTVLEQMAEGRLSLPGFYARRLRRIYPPLLGVVALYLVLAVLLVSPEPLMRQALEGGLALGMVSNIYYAYVTFYFANTALDMPFLHTWFLAALVQIYVAYPVLLMVCIRFFGVIQERLGALVLTMALGSLLAAALYSVYDPRFAYYMPYSRAFAFLAGACAYFYPLQQARLPAWVLQLLGMGGIIICMLLITACHDWPTMYAALPVTLAYICLAAGDSGQRLSHWTWDWLGYCSYTLYLVHWPVMVLAASLGWGECWYGVLGVTLASALVMYRLTERRKVGGGVLRPAWLALIASCIFIIYNRGLPQRLNGALAEEARYGGWDMPDDGRLHIINEHFHQAVDFILSGDSFARQYTRDLEQRGYVVAAVLDDGCYSGASYLSIRPERMIYPSCSLRYENFLAAAAQYPGTVIVIAHDWQRYEHYLLQRSTLTALPQEAYRTALAADLAQLAGHFAERKIYILLSPYQSVHNIGATCLGLRQLDNPLARFFAHTLTCRSQRTLREQPFNAWLQAEAARYPHVVTIDPNVPLCREGRHCKIMLDESGLPVYSDGLHYSQAGAHAALTEILAVMGDALDIHQVSPGP